MSCTSRESECEQVIPKEKIHRTDLMAIFWFKQTTLCNINALGIAACKTLRTRRFGVKSCYWTYRRVTGRSRFQIPGLGISLFPWPGRRSDGQMKNRG